MDILQGLKQEKKVLAVVGLGYVGLPLAEAFARKFRVIGFDSNESKLERYRAGEDVTGEIGTEALRESCIEFTSEPSRLSEAAFLIIAVPTPIHGDKTPDLTAVKSATRTVAEQLQQGTIVVYESTVYPGVTEEICLPMLEQISGLKAGQDFKVGYSPERINPGDRVHRLQNIVKIVSGMDEEACQVIKAVYDEVVETTYPVSSIKVAEAAKLVENAQRDINIAFMNELAQAFHCMDIDTKEVVEAMRTKWNALDFRPGLVGGHCIGVDPYYFIYRAENLGMHSQIIAAGRRVNDGMSEFVALETIKMMIKSHIDPSKAKIYLMGMTFKENCADTRNSRSVDVYRHLKDLGLAPYAVDPWADKEMFRQEYGIVLQDLSRVQHADCLVFLVAHRQFCNLEIKTLKGMSGLNSSKVLIDVKGIFPRNKIKEAGFSYWSL